MGTGRGGAAAGTWIVRGDGSRRRGWDVDSPWGRVAAKTGVHRYAGVYVPTLAEAIVDKGAAYTGAPLKGIAVGNGCSGSEIGICAFGKNTQGLYYTTRYLMNSGFAPESLKGELDDACDWDTFSQGEPISSACQAKTDELSSLTQELDTYCVYCDCPSKSNPVDDDEGSTAGGQMLNAANHNLGTTAGARAGSGGSRRRRGGGANSAQGRGDAAAAGRGSGRVAATPQWRTEFRARLGRGDAATAGRIPGRVAATPRRRGEFRAGSWRRRAEFRARRDGGGRGRSGAGVHQHDGSVGLPEPRGRPEGDPRRGRPGRGLAGLWERGWLAALSRRGSSVGIAATPRP